jgi:hypothetical protein
MKDEMIKAFEKKAEETKNPKLKSVIEKRVEVLRGNKTVNK